MRWMTSIGRLVAAVAMIGLAVPAAAQFSDSYNFLKAVKEKDAAKATEILDKPGNIVVNTRDADTGETALHIATKRSDAAWVGFMLQRGANANARDREGNTPLLAATQVRWSEGVRIFIAIKAQLDAQNRLGETALHKAIQNRDSITAKMLIDAGANPDINDNSGVSARTIANADPRAAALAKMLKDIPVRAARPTRVTSFRRSPSRQTLRCPRPSQPRPAHRSSLVRYLCSRYSPADTRTFARRERWVAPVRRPGCTHSRCFRCPTRVTTVEVCTSPPG